jgi:methylglutaconyl-CoA hydratase
MTYSTIKLAYDARVATITFSRPEKRNALSVQMIEEILSALAEVEKSDALVLIITGAGKAFCAGMDLEELKSLTSKSPAENVADSERMARFFRAIYEFPKPTIAAVNGAAMAGGAGIATMCDFTLALAESTFGYTEVRIGFVPAIVSSVLVWQVGHKIARDLLLTGRAFEAAEAQSLGLVNEVVSPKRLLPRARELAQQLQENSPAALRVTKKLLNSYLAKSLDKQVETAVHENAAIRSTPEFQEGVASFLEKRKPSWSGQ